ncbi:hypothetical protein SAMN05421736_12150 [Evansella caseinilytica]|uniref:Uncharacterized protein n=1 Tax=Evansella caseinilytica TaxID=1503961 RepID=A0A1H3UIE1_9BACI|nr:hypothetical protein SAMN05421736_12150 [Evansella caseinilytica]
MVSGGVFVVYGNMFLLLGSMVFFFLVMICGAAAVVPHETYGKLANKK